MKSFNRIRCLNKAVSEIIDEYNLIDVVVADIGTDHGYLSELLSRNKKIKKVFATDISQKCLDKTNQLISKCNIEKVDTKLGDGLDAVDVVDLAVVAGIGGYEIINILQNQNKINEKRKCDLFVLQPSDNTVELRQWINKNNMLVVSDFIFESAKRFYSIIVVDVSKTEVKKLDDFDLYFGRDNTLENKEFVNYLLYLKESLSYLDGLSKERIDADEVLIQKTKLKILIDKLLDKC